MARGLPLVGWSPGARRRLGPACLLHFAAVLCVATKAVRGCEFLMAWVQTEGLAWSDLRLMANGALF